MHMLDKEHTRLSSLLKFCTTLFFICKELTAPSTLFIVVYKFKEKMCSCQQVYPFPIGVAHSLICQQLCSFSARVALVSLLPAGVLYSEFMSANDFDTVKRYAEVYKQLTLVEYTLVALC